MKVNFRYGSFKTIMFKLFSEYKLHSWVDAYLINT